MILSNTLLLKFYILQHKLAMIYRLAYYNALFDRFAENQRRAIALSVQRAWGKLNTWKASQIRRLHRLFGLLRAHDIKKLQAAAVSFFNN